VKKILIRTMLMLLALLVILALFSAGEKPVINILMIVDIVLLAGVFVFYTLRYAGVCCPHCEVRIHGKYVHRLHRDGLVFCPRCGAVIER
jgi:hypothetical protein